MKKETKNEIKEIAGHVACIAFVFVLGFLMVFGLKGF